MEQKLLRSYVRKLPRKVGNYSLYIKYREVKEETVSAGKTA